MKNFRVFGGERKQDEIELDLDLLATVEVEEIQADQRRFVNWN